MRAITFQTADPCSADVRALIEELDAFQTSLYPIDCNHLMPVELLRQPGVVFMTGSIDGQVTACGAFVNRDGEYAEIKRMYVRPEFRGLRLGRRLLDELESRVRAAGLVIARLETGIYQHEALRLYENAGYRRRGPFGDYVQDQWTVFMEKSL